MSVSTVHVLHGLKTASFLLSQIEDHTASPRIAELIGTPSGHFAPMFTGVRGLQPEETFRTTQLATLLNACGLYGLSLYNSNVDLLYKKVTNLGRRYSDATTTHTRIRAVDSYLYWRSITTGHQREATADARLMCLYDGTNNPLIPAGSVALSGTMSADEYFCLGPVGINGAFIPGIQEATLDLGCETIEVGSDSEPYNSFGAIRQISPVLTLRGLAVEKWTAYGLNGLDVEDFVFYLRRVNADVTGGLPYVANNGGAHIKITGNAGFCAVDQSSGGGKSEVSTALKVYFRASSATTHPLTIAVNQNIDTSWGTVSFP